MTTWAMVVVPVVNVKQGLTLLDVLGDGFVDVPNARQLLTWHFRINTEHSIFMGSATPFSVSARPIEVSNPRGHVNCKRKAYKRMGTALSSEHPCQPSWLL